MFDAFERAIAFRYLRARKGERFVSITAAFSLLGITLGVAALIIVTSVMNGFRADLMNRIIGLNGHLTVQPERGRVLADHEALVARLATFPGVAQAAPVVDGQVLLSAPGGGAGAAMLRGLPPEALAARPVIRRGIRLGSLEAFGEPDSVIVGARLAARLRLQPGDTLTLLLPQARGGDFTAAPRQRALRVAATFDVGMPEYDGRFLFVPLATAQALFGLGEAVNQVELLVDDPARVAQVTAAVRAAVAGSPLRVVDWQGANSSIYAAVVIERNVMFLILTLIVIVAAFNIVSSLTMLVKDKARDIAILRTMGAPRGAILRIFLLCGASIGCGGTLVGFALGLGVATNFPALRGWLARLDAVMPLGPELRFLMQLPSVVEPREVVAILAMGLGLSLLATLYPSWRAARVDPVEGLRHG
ncbi:lipoprotein-releasing ABC transporter permease subunit [Roseomonas alkaliterrae]|uniref:Lipoprotein-releasing system permease protein n=1 Tax=Neoroseomonas alkaliterrae TaxID=1452450 RepID=A0A840XQZ2_9PROT|nr:lipoprotein-releasing ABC transporter permease subunit [Neoroseomonas alkaliterrae]MBB5691058.1 lipoprotein-releasing system permease protein [Neoroseomonas alkaliterrae]MBR0674733.1 lipoprotein-releasing ABC transporter permease subunit [Neoroseomonas alkaliterrae]